MFLDFAEAAVFSKRLSPSFKKVKDSRKREMRKEGLPPSFRMFQSLLAHFGNLATIVGSATRIASAVFGGTTGDIGLSSLTGGNDFGLLIAHVFDFYLFGVCFSGRAGFPPSCGKMFSRNSLKSTFSRTQCTTQHYLLKELNQITKW